MKIAHPLAVLALAFSLGIFAASRAGISFLPIYLSAATLLFLGAVSGKRGLAFAVFISCAVFSLGMLAQRHAQSLPRCHIRYQLDLPLASNCILRGFVEDAPAYKNNRAVFLFSTRALEHNGLNRSCCGNVLVYAAGARDIRYGDELVLFGELRWPPGFQGRSRRSYREYLANQGIWFVMKVENASGLLKLGAGGGCVFKRQALWLKAKMERVIFRYLPPAAAGILDAMILGERKNIPAFINEAMVKAGTVHILVVSGFNVGIVAFIVVLVLKLLRLTRRLRFCIAIPLVMLYCAVTGASTPVVRATVMAVVFLLACLIQREPDIYNALSVAALFILGSNPAQLFDVGFQLSFASVFSIAYLYPKFALWLRTERIRIRCARFLVDGCLVSFSAWIGTMGFIAYYFRIFSPVTVVANILIVPLASFITISGFSLIAAGMVWPALACLVASTSKLAVAALIALNSALVKLPGAYFYLRGDGSS